VTVVRKRLPIVVAGVALTAALAYLNSPAVGSGELSIVVIALLPLLLWGAFTQPQIALAVFLFAGAFTLGTAVAVDVGLLLGAVLWVAVIAELASGREGPAPRALWLVLPIAALVLLGAAFTLRPEYGVPKALRFAALGTLASVGAYALVRTPEQMRRFRAAVTAIAASLAASGVALALVLGITHVSGRFQSFGGGPITLARAAGIGLAGALVAFIADRRSRWWTLPAAGACLYAMFGAGSRGPFVAFLAVAAVMTVLVIVRARLPLPGVIAGLAGAGALTAVAWPYLPTTLTARMELLFSGQLDLSLLGRIDAITTALELWRGAPLLGIGTGSFAAFDQLLYPHNLVIELLAENGVVAAACILGFMVAAALAALAWAYVDWTPEAVFIAAVALFAMLNSMISGDVNDNQMLFAFGTLALVGWQRRKARAPAAARDAVKRAFDVLVSAVGLIVLAPVLAAIAIAVRAKLGSPVLFVQERPGRYGRLFRMYKFRTMTDERDADGRLLPDERRLTHFGTLLRSTSADELPELVNVLKGEMSLVGPRPLLVRYLPLYSATQARRHEVRPGITGWAQVNGRNALEWSDRLALDVWYVDNRSLALDLKVLWMTVARVFSRTGVTAEGHATMPEFTGGHDT